MRAGTINWYYFLFGLSSTCRVLHLQLHNTLYHCTFSYKRMFFFKLGFHAWTQYSRWGLMYVLYKIVKLSIMVMYLKVLVITRRLFMAFCAALVHWMLDLQSLVIKTPKYFSMSIFCRFMSFILYTPFKLLEPKCIVLHLSALKRNSHFSDHFWSADKSSWSLDKSWVVLTVVKILVSSANICILDLTWLGRSLMYRINNRGPKTDPWGTPPTTSALAEDEFLTETVCVLPIKNPFIPNT